MVSASHQRAQQKLLAVKARKRRLAARAQQEAQEAAEAETEGTLEGKEKAEFAMSKAAAEAVEDLTPSVEEKKFSEGDSIDDLNPLRFVSSEAVNVPESSAKRGQDQETDRDPSSSRYRKSSDADMSTDKEKENNEGSHKLDDPKDRMGKRYSKASLKSSKSGSRRRSKGSKKVNRVRIRDDDDSSSFDSRADFFASMQKSDGVTHALDQVFDLLNPLGDDVRSLDDESSIRTERTEETEGAGAFLQSLFSAAKPRDGLLQDMEELFMERLGCAAPSMNGVDGADFSTQSYSFTDDLPTVSEGETVSTGRDTNATPEAPGSKQPTPKIETVVSMEESGPGRIPPSPARGGAQPNKQDEQDKKASPWEEAFGIVESFFDPGTGQHVMQTVQTQATKMRKEFRSDLSFHSVQSSLRDASSVMSNMITANKESFASTEASTVDGTLSNKGSLEVTEANSIDAGTANDASTANDVSTPNNVIETQDSEETKSIHMEEQAGDQNVDQSADQSMDDQPKEVQGVDSAAHEHETATMDDPTEITALETVVDEMQVVSPPGESPDVDGQPQEDVDANEPLEEAPEPTANSAASLIDVPIEQSLDDLKAVLGTTAEGLDEEEENEDSDEVEMDADAEDVDGNDHADEAREPPEVDVPSTNEEKASISVEPEDLEAKEDSDNDNEVQAPGVSVVKESSSQDIRELKKGKRKKKKPFRGLSKLIRPLFGRKKSKARGNSVKEASESIKAQDSLIAAADSLNRTMDSETMTTVTHTSTPQRTPKLQGAVVSPLDSPPSVGARREAAWSPTIDEEKAAETNVDDAAGFDNIMTSTAQDDDWDKSLTAPVKELFPAEQEETEKKEDVGNPGNVVADLQEMEVTNSEYQDFADLFAATNQPTFEENSSVRETENDSAHSENSNSSPLNDDDIADGEQWENVGANEDFFQPVNIQVVTSS